MLIRCLVAALLAGIPAVQAEAVDLSKIERRISKEPVYETTSQEYCLLVFGQKAETRIWLVRDGRALHIDRNANGILGEPGERVTTNTSGTTYIHSITPVKDSPARGYLRVSRYSDGRYRLYFRGTMRQYAGAMKHDKPRFSSKPGDAPIIHFNGPLTLGRYAEMVTLPNPTSQSVRKQSLRLMVGSKGLGKGTFAACHCNRRRNKGGLRADFTFPAKTEDGEPIRQRASLKTFS